MLAQSRNDLLLNPSQSGCVQAISCSGTGVGGKTACCCSIQAFRLAPTMALRHISQVVALANGSANGCTATLSRPGRLASIDSDISATPEPAITQASIPG